MAPSLPDLLDASYVTENARSEAVATERVMLWPKAQWTLTPGRWRAVIEGRVMEVRTIVEEARAHVASRGSMQLTDFAG